jgi:hypothetical protein
LKQAKQDDDDYDDPELRISGSLLIILIISPLCTSASASSSPDL